MKEALGFRDQIQNVIRPIAKGNQEVFVYHSLPGPRPARSYLLTRGASHEDVDLVFSPEGFWDPKIESEKQNPYLMIPNELSNYLREKFKPIYNLIDFSLDGAFRYGYNKHGLEHSDFVAATVEALLTKAGYGLDEVRRGIMAARIHDLGNVFDRKLHPRISTKIAESVLPELATADMIQWAIVKKAVRLHETESLIRFVDPNDIRDADQIIVEMQEKCSLELLALVIADKIAIGRDRISAKPDNINAVEHDVHTEVNLLGKTDSFNVENVDLLGRQQRILWDMIFTPIMTKEELERFPHFELLARTRSFHDGFKAMVSKRTQQRYEDKDIPSPQFQTWQNLYWSKVYTERAFLAIEAAFALFPKATQMRLIMEDPKLDDRTHRPIDREALGIETSYKFKRGYVEEMFAHVAGLYGFRRKRRG